MNDMRFFNRAFRWIFVITIVTCINFCSAFAQMMPYFSQNQTNFYYLNPATAGFENMSVLTSYRQEWSGFDDAPRTKFIGFNFNVNGIKSSVPFFGNLHDEETNKPYIGLKNGLSACFIDDRYGFVKQNNFIINYARHFQLSKNFYFSLGLGMGAFHLGFDDNVTVLDLSDPFYMQFMETTPTVTTMDANAGASIYSENIFLSYYAGHLLGSKLKFSNNSPFDEYLDLSHNLITAIKVGFSKDLLLVPTIKARIISPYLNLIEIGVLAKYKKSLSAGLSYRTNHALVFSLGYQYKGFEFGYSYDYNTARTIRLNNSGHEFCLGYQIRSKSVMPRRFDW